MAHYTDFDQIWFVLYNILVFNSQNQMFRNKFYIGSNTYDKYCILEYTIYFSLVE